MYRNGLVHDQVEDGILQRDLTILKYKMRLQINMGLGLLLQNTNTSSSNGR